MWSSGPRVRVGATAAGGLGARCGRRGHVCVWVPPPRVGLEHVVCACATAAGGLCCTSCAQVPPRRVVFVARRVRRCHRGGWSLLHVVCAGATAAGGLDVYVVVVEPRLHPRSGRWCGCHHGAGGSKKISATTIGRTQPAGAGPPDSPVLFKLLPIRCAVHQRTASGLLVRTAIYRKCG